MQAGKVALAQDNTSSRQQRIGFRPVEVSLDLRELKWLSFL